jgi:two-component system, chemotaxis family, sensor kinase CheA
LSERLGFEKVNESTNSAKKKVALVIMNVKGQKLGLIVDNYYSENEYVIKPLNCGLSDIDGISGAMITGEGSVHLILDPLKLF